MNIRPLLLKKGFDVYEGPLGMIDYDIVELGKEMKGRIVGNETFELLITFSDDQVFIYSFYDHGFSIQRWVKNSK